MKQVIKVSNLHFSYDKVDVIKGIYFQVSKGAITTVIGNTGGGKTTLVKLLSGLLEGTGEIELFEKKRAELSISKLQTISIVFSNPYQQFVTDTVFHDLIFPLENIGLKKEEIDKYVDDIVKLFKIENLLEKKPSNLTVEEASIVAIAIALVTKPQLLILDDAFMHMGALKKKQIFRILRQLNRKFHLTIFNVTHDSNEMLYGSEVILLYNGKIVLKGALEDVLKSEKILKKYHYELPFMAELSDKLRYYNVIDNPVLDMNRMVNLIWK